MSFSFTKDKFCSLDIKKQHKICFQLIYQIYEAKLHNKETNPLINTYHQLTQWMGFKSLNEISYESLSHRYHEHLKCSTYHLKEYNFLPAITSKDKTPQREFLDIAIYLDHIRSAHNVGSIIRTVEAFRIGRVYFSKDTPFIDNKKVKDAAMGAKVPAEQIETLEKLPRPFIALETADPGINIHEFIFPEKFTLIVGNEEYGISEKLLKQCDYIVTIPLYGMKNSLNVSCAFSIAATMISK